MITTIPAILYEVSSVEEKLINNIMFNYGFMVRFSFKRLLDGSISKGDLEKKLAQQFDCNIRTAKDAVEDARQTIKSQKELMKDYLDLWESRYEKTKQKYENLICIPNINLRSKKILGKQNKMTKQLCKIDFYQDHVNNVTFPPVVFGGKENFKKFQNKEISKQEWHQLRNSRYCSRGDATKKGNPNLRILKEKDQYFLEMSLLNSIRAGKSVRYQKIKLPLYVATKYKKGTKELRGRKYPEILDSALEMGKAYEVEILRRNNKFHVHISVTEEETPLVTTPKCGYKGIDTNPDGLAVCHVLPNGNPKKFEWFGDGRFQDAPAEKREQLINYVAKSIVLQAVKDGTGLVVEDLKFIHDKHISAKLNRTTHNFSYKKFLTAIERYCLRYGVELIKVKPQFTSIIGRYKYQAKFGVNVHQSAAYAIARRAMGFKEKVPTKLLKLLTGKQKKELNLKNEWSKWNMIHTRILNISKKRKKKFYHWLELRKELLKSA
jgi:IS605 OrfB family transposase